MFKRPTIRRIPVPQVFTSEVRPNGTVASQWTAAPALTARVPSGHPSRVGEIIDKMRSPPNIRRPEPKWAPPMDYKFVVSHMHPNSQEAYLKRCEEWFEAHPTPPAKPAPVPLVINIEPIVKLFARYNPSPPPLPELVGAWRSAGYTEAKIAKARAWFEYCETHREERQKEIDAIFYKYPTANKPVPKVKVPTKPIKAVKKKMP